MHCINAAEATQWFRRVILEGEIFHMPIIVV